MNIICIAYLDRLRRYFPVSLGCSFLYNKEQNKFLEIQAKDVEEYERSPSFSLFVNIYDNGNIYIFYMKKGKLHNLTSWAGVYARYNEQGNLYAVPIGIQKEADYSLYGYSPIKCYDEDIVVLDDPSNTIKRGSLVSICSNNYLVLDVGYFENYGKWYWCLKNGKEKAAFCIKDVQDDNPIFPVISKFEQECVNNFKKFLENYK